ncbi:MAG: ABC transporter ATP-binding protein [Dethiobacter sp.]|jgi:ABC-type branched-subunit amino acid transport system ATPase component|nr:ABC transporter ATP-binding protein [Dethiobacter sp.]
MLLEISNLTKRFGGLTAVDNISLTIKKGEIFSVIGPNGSGKSTLFNLISGIYPPTSGSVKFNNDNITGAKPHQIAFKGIGRTFQFTTLFQDLRVIDNLIIGHRLRIKTGIIDVVLRTRQARDDEQLLGQKCMVMLDFINLTSLAFRPVNLLTQEEQKRLSIGTALMSSPELLLLDEPTGCVNIEEIHNLIQLVRKIKEKGVTVCLIEHKMRVVMDLADRIAVLNYGKKIAEGDPAEIRNNEEVIRAYLGGEYVA